MLLTRSIIDVSISTFYFCLSYFEKVWLRKPERSKIVQIVLNHSNPNLNISSISNTYLIKVSSLKIQMWIQLNVTHLSSFLPSIFYLWFFLIIFVVNWFNQKIRMNQASKNLQKFNFFFKVIRQMFFLRVIIKLNIVTLATYCKASQAE